MPKIASDAICDWGFIFFNYFRFSFVNIKRLFINLIKQVVDKVYFQLIKCITILERIDESDSNDKR